jgi:hypothetical protein
LLSQSVPRFQHFSECNIASVVSLCFKVIESGIRLTYCCCECTLQSFFRREKHVRGSAAIGLGKILDQTGWESRAPQHKPSPKAPLAGDEFFKVGGIHKCLLRRGH